MSEIAITPVFLRTQESRVSTVTPGTLGSCLRRSTVRLGEIGTRPSMTVEGLSVRA